MSVSSSDKTESRNVNSQKAEEYREQLAAKEKKHRKEVARMRHQHYEAAKKNDEIHQKQLQTMRQSLNETLSEKDKHYQEKIEQLNEMHRNKLRSQAEDYGERIDVTRKTAEEDIKTNQKLQSRQRERLENNYKNQFAKSEKEFRDFAHYTREQQAEAYNNQKARYHEDKAETLKTINESFENKLEKSDRELKTERQYRDTEIGNLKERMTQQADDMRKAFRSTLDRDRAFHNDVLEAQQIAQKDSIENVKRRYQEALKDNMQSYGASQENFRKDIASRMNDQVVSLEQQLADKQKHFQGEKIKDHRQNEFEKNNLRREMKISNEMLSEQKTAAVKNLRTEHRQDLREEQKKHDKELHGKIRYYQGNISEMREKHRQNMNEKENIHTWQTRQLDKQADDRVKNIKEATFKEQKNLEEYYQSNIETLKDEHRKDKAAFQTSYYRERNEAIASLNKKMQEIEQQYAKERAKERRANAEKIEQMAFQHRLDKNRLEKRLKETVENLQKTHARELEYTKATSESKLDSVIKQHKEQIERMQERHVKEMESLATHKKV